MSSRHNCKMSDKFLKRKQTEPKKRKDCCKTCGSHKSACQYQFNAPKRKMKPLTSDCVLVNSLVCSKTVQKVAELPIPLTDLFTGIIADTPLNAVLAAIVSITVTPNLASAVINRSVIKNKVVNMGFVPATVTVTVNAALLPDGVTLITPAPTFFLPFQAHTDCPGACPGDTVMETPFVLEGTFTQPGVSAVGAGGILTLGILVKAIFRTTLTVTRPVIVDKDGDFCAM